jgi:hypothetical protein
MLKNLCNWISLILPVLLFSNPGHADHVVLAFGPSLNGGTNPKMAQLGYEFLFDHSSLLTSCAAMFESETNGWCSAVVSARVQTSGGMFTRVGVGPAAIFHTDDRLGTIPEFNIQYALGFEQDGWDIGIIGNHLSNASLWQGVNQGRDFAALLVEIWI